MLDKELLRQELMKRMEADKAQQADVGRMVDEQRKMALLNPEYRKDLRPMAAFADELTGSNLARVAERPESTQEALRKALAYKMQQPISGAAEQMKALLSHDLGQQKIAAAAQKAGNNKMSGETMKRLGSARVAAQALKDVESALGEGSSILPEFMTGATGDTKFTEAARRFAEGFGRMQSGAAISADEETRFKRLLPRFQDSDEMRQMKLQRLKQEIQARMQEMGGDAEFNQPQPMNGIAADGNSFDLQQMSDEQLQAIISGK